jgi:hypothetical protein
MPTACPIKTRSTSITPTRTTAHRRRSGQRRQRQEVDAGTKPLDHASHLGAANDQAPQGQQANRSDTDNDGLFNDDEIHVYGTNPNKADTDGDGRDDGQEVFDKTDPNNPFDCTGSDDCCSVQPQPV